MTQNQEFTQLISRRDALQTLSMLGLAPIAFACGGKAKEASNSGMTPMSNSDEMLVAQWEAKGLLTAEAPGKWSGKIAGHYPIANVVGNTVSVVTPHGMSGEHFIEAIYIKDASGKLLGLTKFTPEDSAALASFQLADASIDFKVYSVCNLHDVWEANPVRTAAAPGPWAAKVEGHTPLASMEGMNSVKVSVPHGMSVEHFIACLYITDATGNMLGKVQLDPNTAMEASHVFELPSDTTVTEITPWALCNKHDLWVGASMTL